MDLDKPFCVISDVQEPYGHPMAIPLAKYIKRYYGVPDCNMINIGDEVDHLHGGVYEKDPDNYDSPLSEIHKTKAKMKLWFSEFPQMMVCDSNHGVRWARKARIAGIPSIFMRQYQTIIEAPPTWRWQKEWYIPTKHPFRAIHGLGFSGESGHKKAALKGRVSTVIGHLHSFGGNIWQETVLVNGIYRRIWGMNSGCLIDLEAIAFKYGEEHAQKPALGMSVILNRGSTPIWHPLE